jgi:DNA-binding PadR family transcriptional regulator
MSTPVLTTTSYAVLGLLAIRPWGTYELTQQMERSLQRFWPRALSKVYEEPKKLVALGLARSRAESVGRRRRTVYRITPKGRRALAGWLDDPAAGPVLEFEGLLKVFFSEHGTKDAARSNIAAIRAWAEARNAENVHFAREYLADGGPFPARLPQIMLVGRFLADFTDMVDRWAEWAEEVVADWPDEPGDAEPRLDALAHVAARPLPA